jgi:hypothetical protein
MLTSYLYKIIRGNDVNGSEKLKLILDNYPNLVTYDVLRKMLIDISNGVSQRNIAEDQKDYTMPDLKIMYIIMNSKQMKEHLNLQ